MHGTKKNEAECINSNFESLYRQQVGVFVNKLWTESN